MQREGRQLEGTRSPWGIIDAAGIIAPGISWVGTPSHGGLKLSRAQNAIVPKQFRRDGGWYEEDCEWAIAFHFLKDHILKHTTDIASVAVIQANGAQRAIETYYPQLHAYIKAEKE